MSVQPRSTNDGELLTPGAVAAVLFVDPKTVTRWARAGKIDSIRTPGGHRRYRRADVYALRAGGAARRPSSGEHADAGDPALPLQPQRPRATSVARAADSSTSEAPWAATVLAEAVAVTLELEAEAAVERVWFAQAELDAARDRADEASARAQQARLRAEAESERVRAGSPLRTASAGFPPRVPRPRSPRDAD